MCQGGSGAATFRQAREKSLIVLWLSELLGSIAGSQCPGRIRPILQGADHQEASVLPPKLTGIQEKWTFSAQFSTLADDKNVPSSRKAFDGVWWEGKDCYSRSGFLKLTMMKDQGFYFIF